MCIVVTHVEVVAKINVNGTTILYTVSYRSSVFCLCNEHLEVKANYQELIDSAFFDHQDRYQAADLGL